MGATCRPNQGDMNRSQAGKPNMARGSLIVWCGAAACHRSAWPLQAYEATMVCGSLMVWCGAAVCDQGAWPL